MLHAEQTISRWWSTQFSWSPTLAQACSAVKYWRLKVKQKQNLKVSEYILQATKDSANIEVDIGTIYSWNKLTNNLQLAQQRMKMCRRDHVQLRETYLHGLAEAIILKWCPSLSSLKMAKVKARRIAKEIKELIKRERNRSMYRKIGACLNPATANIWGLTWVDVPSGNHPPYPAGPDPKLWKVLPIRKK